MKKLTRKTLSELSQQKELLTIEMQKTFIGGGYGTFHNPYTFEEYKHYGGGSEVYYLNEFGQLSYNLPEVVVVGHQGGYNGNTASPIVETPWANYGGKSDTGGNTYETPWGDSWANSGDGNGSSPNGWDTYSGGSWYNGNSGAPIYGGGSWSTAGKVADGIELNMAVKEAIIGLVDEAQLGKAASRYLIFTKMAGKACGGIGVLIAAQKEFTEPTTCNTIKLAISIGSLALGPVGSTIFCVLDVAGGVDYMSEVIAKQIEGLTHN